MRKKVLLVMGLSLLLLAGGCGKKGAAGNLDSNSNNPTTTPTTTTVTEQPVKPEYEASKYVTLGDYKGVEVNVTKLTVTDQDVEEYIQYQLTSNPTYEEITDRTDVQDGDVVNIDYEGLKDGVAFDGGTAQGANLTIGSGQFIDGFESGLIGKKVGEKVKLNLKFPDTYGNADLAGQEVVFNVTINKIQKEVTPELTEEYVKNNTDYDTIDAYKKSVREDLETQMQSTMDDEKLSNLFTKIIDAAKISEIPTALTQYYSDSMNYQVYQEATNNGATDIEAYITQNNMTMDQFNEYVKSYSESAAKQELVIRAVAEAEKMSVTDKEVKDKISELMTNYGYETEKDLFADMSETTIKDNMLLQKSYDFIVDNCVVKEVEPTPAPTATPAAE